MTAAEPLDPERLAAIKKMGRQGWLARIDGQDVVYASEDLAVLLAEVERLQALLVEEYRRGAEHAWDERDRKFGSNPYRSPQPDGGTR